jgi:hypothetical protein
MSLSIFDDQSHMPASEDLSKVLEGTYKVWNSIKDYVLVNHPGAEEEWKFAGQKYGWGFRVKDKKRVIIYMSPAKGFIRFSMVLGEKATAEAMKSGISKDIRTIIEKAPVYAEGRGFRIELKDEKLMEDIRKLIMIKLAN